MADKLDKLYKEIERCRAEYGEKRKFYDKRVTICNIAFSVFTVLSILAILVISPDSDSEIFLKIVAILMVCLSGILTRVIKINGYGEKLLQRSITYFALCDLSRSIRLDENSREKYDTYKKEFQRIMERDNEMGLYNSIRIVNILNDNMKKSLEKETEMQKE